MLAIFEALVHALAADAISHHLTQWSYVDTFGCEVFHLVLLRAEHRVNLRISHPGNLRTQSNHEWRLRLTRFGINLLLLLELAL